MFFSIISVEHSLCVIAGLHYILVYCTEKDPITEMIKSLVPHIMTQTDRIPYWLAFFIYFINVCATFVWTYMDVFIMMISIGISTLFKQLNNELEQTKVEVEFRLRDRMKQIKIILLFSGSIWRILGEHANTIWEIMWLGGYSRFKNFTPHSSVIFQ